MIIDANGRRIPPTSVIALVIRMGKRQMSATFFVVKHLAEPVLLGCAFARRNVRAILPMDDKSVLASDETISFPWRTPTRGDDGRRRQVWSFQTQRPHHQGTENLAQIS